MILGIGIERIIKNHTNYFLPSKTTTLHLSIYNLVGNYTQYTYTD